MIPVTALWFWFVLAWALLIAVSLRRWRERERRDAAETQRVMKSLLHDTSHQYEQDAL